MVKNSHYTRNTLCAPSVRVAARVGVRRETSARKSCPSASCWNLNAPSKEARSLTQQHSMPAHHQGSAEPQQKSSGRISSEKCGAEVASRCAQEIRASLSPSDVVSKSESINGSGRKTPKSKHQTNPSPIGPVLMSDGSGITEASLPLALRQLPPHLQHRFLTLSSN